MPHSNTVINHDIEAEQWEVNLAPISSAALTGGTPLYSFNFDDNQEPAEVSSWTLDGGTLSYANGYASGVYPANVSEIAVGFSVGNINSQTVYLEFDAQMPNAVHGVKFVKLFGANNGGGYANITYGLDYTGIDNGGMIAASFGDGANAGNHDTATPISLYEPTYNSYLGRNSGIAQISQPQPNHFRSTDWGTDWHHFRLYFKHNTGTTAENEVNDGAIYVEIDGKIYLDAGNIFTRHFDNGQEIETLRLFDWSQGGGPEFTLNYDNVVISTDGFVG